MLLILFGTFAEKIKPTPDECLSKIIDLIPKIAKAKVEQLTSYVNDALDMLRRDPTDIHQLVAQFEFRKRIMSELTTIQGKSKDYTAFYILMADNKFQVSEEANAEFKELGGLIGQLETQLMSMKDEEESKIKKWNPYISQLLQSLSKNLIDLHRNTNREDIMSADSDPVQCNEYISVLKRELDSMIQRADQIQSYQKTIQQKVSHIDDLQVVTKTST